MTVPVDYCPAVRFSEGVVRKRSSMLWAVVCVMTVWLRAGVTVAMEVTSSGPQTIKKGQGEKVTLGCTYTPGAADTGDVDIEWSNVSPDMTQKDHLVLSFTAGRKYAHGESSLMKRLDFLMPDPSQGDASIAISGLQVSDTATYQCKVKKAPGVDMRKVTMVVLVPPSEPKCWVEGSEEVGGTVSLRCKSSLGSSPMTYTWKRESGRATATQNSQSGELLISNHSASFMGNYLCAVKNEVGRGQCRYTLRAVQPTNRTGVIVGAVIGTLLALLLIFMLIWLLIWLCYNQIANEISFRSVPGHPTHPGMAYSSVRNAPPWKGSGRSSVFTERSNHAAPAHSQGAPPLKYDSRYGYPV
ncbi:hypothetical protein AAFF_G00390080 [Aldrovandia affinis]|uniref:Ig-like domain-containing protein n=1 Tax=Aldrovandia affinis TaxID=143900 RepID=A0AAD7WL55_9TELE|nr:hypothetical protein AAFF_G00390080 [Aldrovandia affinis]